MNVVCCSHSPDPLLRDTLGQMQRTRPELGLELHGSLDSFASRLGRPGRDIALVLLSIADRRALSDLLVLRPLLNDLPIVVLLNDQEPEILKFAHELRPMVIMYTCWPMTDICSVLQRCIGRHGKGEWA